MVQENNGVGVNPDFNRLALLVIAVVKGIDYNFFNGLVGIAGDADALGPVAWFNDLFFDQLVLQYSMRSDSTVRAESKSSMFRCNAISMFYLMMIRTLFLFLPLHKSLI